MFERVILASLLCLGVLYPAAAQELMKCPPPKNPLCLCACVEPATRSCDQLPSNMPMVVTLRHHLARYLFDAPETIKPFLSVALGWSDEILEDGFETAVIAARCFSDSAPGPTNPVAVPDEEVKAWLLAVLDQGPPPHRVVRPLIAGLPANIVKYAYLRAVEVKRGYGYGALGETQ